MAVGWSVTYLACSRLDALSAGWRFSSSEAAATLGARSNSRRPSSSSAQESSVDGHCHALLQVEALKRLQAGRSRLSPLKSTACLDLGREVC